MLTFDEIFMPKQMKKALDAGDAEADAAAAVEFDYDPDNMNDDEDVVIQYT